MKTSDFVPPRLSDADRWIGSLEQLCELQEVVHVNGPARGERMFVASSPSGISVELLPDRCLDIGRLAYKGIPLVWLSSTGLAQAPATTGADVWLRNFGGGLLSTCGLDAFGPAGEDSFGATTMHGVIGSCRASITRQEIRNDGVIVEGVIRQSRIFGENFELRRSIVLDIDVPRIRICDEVRNLNDRDWPHMLLYHMNFGWPLISPSAILEENFLTSEYRDDVAKLGFLERNRFCEPTEEFEEQVFHHTLRPSTDPNEVIIKNGKLGIALTLRTKSEQLPFMHQWRMMGVKTYALGLEPSNSKSMKGREKANYDNAVSYMQPNEMRQYDIEVEVSTLN